MKTNNFKQIGKVELSNVYGGTKVYKTHVGDPEKPLYTDTHLDNDEDGIWSSGDEFVVTMS
ncbi:hypothetical protein IMCC3317_40710 [Kordia antarctica]|uniref:Uncharacterized protein n=1 Tax=Kordia antarctica TaxID=1218801 RepID=A0A7L4ZQC0_9FLAO|nr:hypothetical protein [Kordia antarctica]QHI38677.1 hypothetical protein IMCC3317_40710 [Kordia antarctica]